MIPVSPSLINKTNSSHYRKAWMTSGLLKFCRKINIVYKKFLSNLALDNKFKFISYRNKFEKLKEAAFTQFFSNKFCLYEKNCRKTLDVINHLMNRKSHHPLRSTFYDTDGQSLTSSIEIANSFNAFFSNIGNKIFSKKKFRQKFLRTTWISENI